MDYYKSDPLVTLSHAYRSSIITRLDAHIFSDTDVEIEI
jgi:hypothetical protein